MKDLRKLATDMMGYGMSTVVGRFLNWLMVIPHTYIFKDPKQLFENNQMYVYIVVLSVVYTFGMETTFLRFASKSKNKTLYFNQCVTFIFLISVFFSGVCILFSSDIATFLGFPQKERLVVWTALLLALEAWVAIPFAKLRLENKVKTFVKLRLLHIFSTIFLNLFYIFLCKGIYEGKFLVAYKPFASFFYSPKIGADYIIWANFLSSFMLFILFLPSFRHFRFQFTLKEFKPLFLYAYPLLFMGLIGLINLTIDRLLFRYLLPHGFYRNLSTEAAFSIYANAYKLSVFITLVIQSYRYAAEPYFFGKMKSDPSPFILSQSTRLFTLFCLFLGIGICLFLPVLSFFLAPAYRGGVVVVPYLIFGNIFLGVYQNLSMGFKLTDTTFYTTKISLIGLLSSLIFNYLFVPKGGYLGCAIAFCLSSFLVMVLGYIWSQKVYPMILPIKNFFVCVVSGIAILLISTSLKIDSLLLKSIISLFLWGIYFVVLLQVEYKKQFSEFL